MARRRNHADDDYEDDDYPSPEPTIGFVLPSTSEPPEPVRCTEHRKYQAKRKPRTLCEACWRMFVERNPV